MPRARPGVETHPQRDDIIQSLVAGEGPTSISKRISPYLSRECIGRYCKRHLGPAAKLIATASGINRITGAPPKRNGKSVSIARQNEDAVIGVSLAQPLIDRLFEHQADIDVAKRSVMESREGLDARDLSALIATDRGLIETHAKLAKIGGYAPQDQAPAGPNILVVMPALTTPSQPLSVIQQLAAEDVTIIESTTDKSDYGEPEDEPDSD